MIQFEGVWSTLLEANLANVKRELLILGPNVFQGHIHNGQPLRVACLELYQTAVPGIAASLWKEEEHIQQRKAH